MTVRALFAAAFALALACGAVPASADNGKTPPGAPCAKGNGNPCGGNNGNGGAQGNAGRERVSYGTPGTIDIPLPPVSNRSAYIEQVGDANRARVAQTAPDAFADVRQAGGRNDADVAQNGSGRAFAALRQAGDRNIATVRQDGGGQNVLHVGQSGDANALTVRQTAAGAIHNGAVVAQAGAGNRMALTQDGGGNRALLAQTGDGNAMTATQTGDGNRLAWTQDGNNLLDLGIKQTGGAAMQITQTGGR